MKRELDPAYVNSVDAIEDRIAELKATYSNIITNLIRYYVQNVSDDAVDRYMHL